MKNAFRFLLLVVALAAAALIADVNARRAAAADDPAQTAAEILKATGVQGGLVVYVGGGEGRLTAALAAGEGYLAHGLMRDDAGLKKAREQVRAAGKYGRVSLEHFAGERLPYADNLVNLVVLEDSEAIAEDELLRVLRPGGVAYIRQGSSWTKLDKPWPKEIDEWTHFMHGPDNNAVAKDSVVGPPHHVQWIGGPRWARGHEVLATISAAVTARGRIFYIADEGPIASVDLPSNWVLIARDAFNGVLLWKRQISNWESRYRPFRSGPPQLPRRLVAVGDTVYVTPGYLTPLTALDAATGEVTRTYENTQGTEEILVVGDVLYLVLGDPKNQEAAEKAARRGKTPPPIHKQIVALQADSGKVLWKKADQDTSALYAQTMAVADERLFFQNTRHVLCLDAKTGEETWRTERPSALNRPAWSVPTLVVHNGVVISADRHAPEKTDAKAEVPRVNWKVSFAGGGSTGEMVALDVKSGKQLWRGPCKEGYNAPVDVLLTDGLLWSGNLVGAREPGITKALDPTSGEVKRTRPDDHKFFTPGMSHHRCYRNRATEKYIVLGRSGVELVDVKTGRAEANHYVRGACQFGVLPANGMIYVPPHTCACYLKTKLNGFNALAPLRPGEKATEVDAQIKGEQLAKGPAIDEVETTKVEIDGDDWPTYRHDAARSGATEATISPKLKQSWQTEIGGDLTAITSAGQHVFVAREDEHTVHALNAQTGEPLWQFTAGGRVDSPPTIDGDLAIFGSMDGHVYCVRAEDGRLVWRFRAGPEDRRIIAENHLESAWPVHGSVLVKDDVVYFAAGRSSYLDGGIFLYGLNPQTGEVVAQSRFWARDPKTGEQPKSAVQGFDMPSGLPDVLSARDEFVFMRDLKFDDQCSLQPGKATHLFSPTGFLDDSWWHRSYWLYGTHYQSGWGGWWRAGNQFPAGRLLVVADDKIYGFGRSFYPGGNAGQWKKGEHYRLFAAAKELKQPAQNPPDNRKRRRRPQPRVDYLWSQNVEPEARAMILAGDTLFIAGPHGETHEDPDAFAGKLGVSLQAISAADGTRLASYELKSLPVFDGLAAARGRLFLATRDGKLTCYAAGQ